MDVFDLAAKITLDSSGFESELGKAKSSFESMATKAAVVGQAIYDAMKFAAQGVADLAQAAFNVGVSFDSSMSNVAAISGATGDELEALRDKAKEMGSTTKFSATEAADAFSYMAMAGWKTEDMLSGIDGILNLAAASGEDLATTSDIVTDALTAFGYTASDSAHFADILAAASSNANTNVSMMGETFKYVAPLAGAMGYTAEDVAVAVGLMANSGIKASQAGTSLRAALSALINPSEASADVMRSLGIIVQDTSQVFDEADIASAQDKVATATGNLEKKQIAYNKAVEKYGAESAEAETALINVQQASLKLESAQEKLRAANMGTSESVDLYNAAVEDADGNALSLSDTLDVLRTAFSQLSESEQTAAAAAIFGQEAMSGMLALINAAPADVAKLEEAVTNAEGAAQSMAEIMQDNVGGAMDNLESALEGAGIALYEVFSEDLQEWINKAADAIGRLTTAFTEGGPSAAVDEFVKIFKELTNIDLGPAVEKIRNFSEKTGELISAAKKGFEEGDIPGAVDAIIGKIDEWTELDLSGVRENIRESLDGIKTAFEDFKTAYDESGVGGVIDELVQKFKDTTGIDLGPITTGISGFFDNFASESIDELGRFVESIGNFIKMFANDGGEWTEVFNGFIKGVGELLPMFGEEIGERVGTIADAFGRFVDKLTENDLSGDLLDVATSIGDLTTSLQKAYDTLSPIFESIEIYLSTGLATLGSIVGDVVSLITDQIAPCVDNLSGYIKILVGLVTLDLPMALEGLAQVAQSILDSLENILDKIYSIFEDILGFGWDVIAKGLGYDDALDRSQQEAWEEANKTIQESGVSREEMLGSWLNTGNVDFSNSGIGKSSSSVINGMLATSGTGGDIHVNLNVDGKTVAEVTYDPLSDVAKQRG